MNVEDVFYRIGGFVESAWKKIKDFINPKSQDSPPTFEFLRKIVKRKVTVHELLVLKLQLAFISYLLLSLLLVVFLPNELYLVALTAVYFIYLRTIFRKYREFFIEYRPYQMFYYSISVIGFLAFFGYSLLKRFSLGIHYSLGYLVFVSVVVIMFRFYFKSKYGRNWTYGVIEEIKENVVKISVHDDIRANVRPGEYWVDKVPDVKIGRVVKVLVEERAFRGAVPTKIIEVYLSDQPSSSKASTEAKKENETNSSL
ncbi:DUF2101 family protein [Thermococcus paralvinellae]|uniref:DUF2101 domain-containing protein n=1 Tax=Thermococcus paralvinellae TaxID=582419 RepID=W0I5K8_9EURY|nr:DUF2101 family protein [Thermococcus paralvinellae]AHF81354.1 Hypothetical protein TES1_1979 [Thermococcus paralvinellae]